MRKNLLIIASFGFGVVLGSCGDEEDVPIGDEEKDVPIHIRYDCEQTYACNVERGIAAALPEMCIANTIEFLPENEKAKLLMFYENCKQYSKCEYVECQKKLSQPSAGADAGPTSAL
jgi:hypothetical protein